MREVGLAGLRALAFGMGLAFPFVPVAWKIVILILSLILRIVDSDNDGKLVGATPLFFIGMIAAFSYKLLSGQ